MRLFWLSLLGALAAFSPAFDARAQLVADGATAAINGVSTNLAGDLTIGASGSFTTLIFTNGGSCSNSGNGVIGLNLAAKTNRVLVTGAGSVWTIAGNLSLGDQGSSGLLLVTNGGRVADNYGNISLNAGSFSNTAIITGANSVWTNQGNVNIGNTGPFNLVLVTNGGLLGCASEINVGNTAASNQLIIVNAGAVVSDSAAVIGYGSFSSANMALVSGPTSQWVDNGELDVGDSGSQNQMIVTNGGTVYSQGVFVGADSSQGGSGSSNSLVLTGTGSSWVNYQGFGLGNFGSFNQMSILSGAVFTCQSAFQSFFVASQAGSGNNVLLVSNANSLFAAGGDSFYLGLNGPSNRLVLATGGALLTAFAYIGSSGSASNNLAFVTDPRSSWTNISDLQVGVSGSFNQLTISNFATVTDQNGVVGFGASATGNGALVTGSFTIWTNLGNLYVGQSGSSNQLVVTNSGIVGVRSNLYVGFNASASNNSVTLAGGTVLVTNSGAGKLDVRGGVFTLTSGTLATDLLLLTNGTQSGFNFTGGTVQTGGTTVSNGSVFTVGNGLSNAVLQLTGNGAHAFANGLRIASHGSLTGNGTISGNVTNSGGTLSPGNSIGHFTITGNLSLGQGSSNVFELNKSLATNDSVSGLTGVTYGGTLLVTNLGGALAGGDGFKLFSAAAYAGAFTTLTPATPGAGLRWSTNGLIVDGVLRVATAPTTAPRITNAKFSDATHLAIHAGGGVPYETVYLRTATNASLSLSNWAYLATNIFDATSNATFSASFTATEPRRFFILQVQ